MRFGFDDLVAVMARLRGPDGCPWDREQTHASLAPFLLEETHEVLDAIARVDVDALREELGDLLLQVVFHAQMAREAGGFQADDVVDGLVRKLIDRHPHVFGAVRLETAGEVLAQWHERKRQETPGRGPFDGIPASLPALARAQKLLGRASDREPSGISRDPSTAAAQLRAGVETLIAEMRPDGAGVSAEALGTILLGVAALAEASGIDAETTLRAACDRFVTDHATAHGPARRPTA